MKGGLKKMNKEVKYGKIVGVILGILLIVSLCATGIMRNNFSDELAAKDIIIGDKDSDISDLAQQIVDITNVPEVEDTEVATEVEITVEEVSGYLIDNIVIGEGVSEYLTDRDISLFDGDVEFNGSEYSAEEFFHINGLKLTANREDFNADVYAVAEAGDIEYAFVIYNMESEFEIGDYDDDEKLSFNFLGL